MNRRVVEVGCVLLMLVGCKPPVRTTPPPAAATAEEVALSGAAVLIGAGDIAVCGTDGDEQTAALVDSVLRADSVAKVSDAVFTVGDNAYPDGSASNFAICFAASWGDSTKRIMQKIRPSPGNHEHLSRGAAPYYKYFGDRAGEPSKGYYSYDLGEWHVIVINSEIMVNGSFTIAERRAQEDWIKKEVSGTQRFCTVAYWHHPLYSSGWHGGNAAMRSIWQLLQDAGVDLILTGHDHGYERFLPLNGLGMVDSAAGMVQYVIGTGGGDLRGFQTRASLHSAARVQGHFGVLKLTLGKGEFRSAFLDVSGRIWDQSGGKCRQAGMTIPKP